MPRIMPFWRGIAVFLLLAAGLSVVAIARNGDLSTPVGRAWIFLGSQTVLETLLVAAAFAGRPIAGLRAEELQRDFEAAARLHAWLGAAAVAAGYVAISAFGDPGILRLSLTFTPLKATAVLLAVVTGIFEEGFFRRFLMDAFQKKGRGRFFQIAASGVVFGLAHFGFAFAGGDLRVGLGAMIYTTFLGAALAAVYLDGDRNLWPCIAAHFAINLALEPGLGLLAAGFK